MSSHVHQHDPGDTIEILLVEDNPGDIRLTEEAFKATDSETNIRAVTDGDETVALLERQVDDQSRSLPDIALVDLNLPGRDGCAVLQTIRDDPRLNPLPVLIFTSSEAPEDIRRCYDAHTNAYLTKPGDPDEFSSLVKAVEKFWFERVQFPSLPS